METETFQQQALPVRTPDENFDGRTFIPQDGEEYLMQVVYERKNCPSIVTVKSPIIEMCNLNQEPVSSSSLIAELSISTEINDISPATLRPSNEWKQAQFDDFQEMREKIFTLREELETKGYTSETNLPLIDEVESWYDFCRLNEPFLSIMLRINQRSLEKLLEFASEWMNDEIEGETINLSGEDIWLGKWIYSIMVCLRMPLEADVHSSLRDIARSCITLRNKLKPNEHLEVAPYNLFVFLIAKYFGQLDFLEFV